MDLEFIFGDYRYYDAKDRVYTFDYKQVGNLLDYLQKECGNGFFVGYVSYEVGLLNHSNDFTPTHKPSIPLLDFTYFKSRQKLPPSFYEPINTLFYPNLLKNLNYKQYTKDFKAIKQELKRGNTYQVNYTQEIHLQTHLESLEIFKSLIEHQNTPYKAYLKTDFIEILSLSPELFFILDNHKITLQPMKGTIRRGANTQSDREYKKALQQDSKNRSENIMIVDLLRNDISQIAKPHTLKIQNLLKVKTYPTLHQMVSTLSAKLPKNATLSNIFQAIFPCGSITGAPKLSTMQILRRLEKRDRGVYCGSIGVVSEKQALFSVPIRTLTRTKDEDFYRYGVGSGVVWEGDCESEFRELELKSKFLWSSTKDFYLLETIYYEKGKAFLLREHLERLQRSARELGFNHTQVLRLLSEIKSQRKLPFMQKHAFSEKDFLSFSPNLFSSGWDRLPKGMECPNSPCILRLLLSKKGALEIEQKPLNPLTSHRITLSRTPINSHNDLLYHKSTAREWYREAEAKWGEVFDVIFMNEKGYITEGARSNVVILKGKELLTPSLESGLLSGTLRSLLLKHKVLKESPLREEDLYKAKSIYCINSVRGIVKVEL